MSRAAPSATPPVLALITARRSASHHHCSAASSLRCRQTVPSVITGSLWCHWNVPSATPHSLLWLREVLRFAPLFAPSRRWPRRSSRCRPRGVPSFAIHCWRSIPSSVEEPCTSPWQCCRPFPSSVELCPCRRDGGSSVLCARLCCCWHHWCHCRLSTVAASLGSACCAHPWTCCCCCCCCTSLAAPLNDSPLAAPLTAAAHLAATATLLRLSLLLFSRCAAYRCTASLLCLCYSTALLLLSKTFYGSKFRKFFFVLGK